MPSAHEGMNLQLEKTDSRVDYRASDPKGWQCQSCRFFDASTSTCALVEGTIDPTWTCDLWTSMVGSQGDPDPDATAKAKKAGEPDFQIFIDASQSFGIDPAPSQWIPFLPKPGNFSHPKYGQIQITPERNQEMVKSIKDRVYQEHIPIDAEHETKLSGAMAWIKDMRVNADGSADAYVDWTDRGKTLVGGGGYKYISPEWFTKWRDPATGVVHTNIVAGGAITTRPFFKDASLRALTLSEKAWEMAVPDGLYWFRDYDTAARDTMAKSGEALPDGSFPIANETDLHNAVTSIGRASDRPSAMAHIKTRAKALGATSALPDSWNEGERTMADKDPKAPEAPEAPVGMTEAQVEAKIKDATTAVEEKYTEQLAEVNTKLAAAESLAASEKTAREAATTALVQIQADQREQRFKAMIAGQGGDGDGAKWIGDDAKHLSVLTGLAESFGETVEEGKPNPFGDYVENQKAIAAQAAEANLFSEAGTTGKVKAGTPDAKFEAMTQALLKVKPSLNHSQAYAEVLETPEGQALYAESPSGR